MASILKIVLGVAGGLILFSVLLVAYVRWRAERHENAEAVHDLLTVDKAKMQCGHYLADERNDGHQRELVFQTGSHKFVTLTWANAGKDDWVKQEDFSGPQKNWHEGGGIRLLSNEQILQELPCLRQ